MTQVQDLGRALRTQRLASGLSQQTVCRSAGVARSWLSKVEAGRHGGAEVQKLLDLATVLGLRVALVPVDAADPVEPAEPVDVVHPAADATDPADAVETTGPPRPPDPAPPAPPPTRRPRSRPRTTPTVTLPQPAPVRPPAWSGGDPFEHLFD